MNSLLNFSGSSLTDVERSVVTVLFDFQLASLQAELPLLEDLLFVGKKVAIIALLIVNRCDKEQWGQETI